MRITFILPHANLSGGTRVVATYAALLTQRGHKVCVVSAPAPRPTWRDCVRSVAKGSGWPAAPAREASHLDGLPIEHRVIDRRRALRDADVPDADVIVATWWETAEWILGLDESKGAGAYFIQHDETVFFAPEAEEGRRRVEATWRLPLHKFVVAKWLADLGPSRGAREPIDVVPNAVDHRLFFGPPRQKQPRPTIGFMYSTTRFKGCDTAVEAIRLARRSVAGLEVVAFGMDEPTAQLPLPAGTRYSRRPPQDELRSIYGACDGWLFSSRSEGFGLPILEAMACRTPVIGTPAGPAPDLIGFGGGVLVKPENPADMARAIEELAAMPQEQWAALSSAAERNAARFTWEQSTALLERTLSTAVEARRSRMEGIAR